MKAPKVNIDLQICHASEHLWIRAYDAVISPRSKVEPESIVGLKGF